MIIEEVVSQRSDINDLNYLHAIFPVARLKKNKVEESVKRYDFDQDREYVFKGHVLL